MPPKELCRNFQRGSCRYGDKCRFLHSTQQQPKTNNPFGFGVQSSSNFQSSTLQQPKTNPFGFGVQNAPQQNVGANFGASRQSNGFKPFENKWTRTSSATGGSSNASQKNQNQSQGSIHKCTDPNECKKLIAADFEDERPLWKLTCYGHFKHLPCDISGDTSYEELRAAAYEDAKRGMPLQSIVERERSLQQSKLVEFESFLRSPYTKQQNSDQSLQNPFPSITPNPSSLTTQNLSPSPISSKPPGNPFGFGLINNPSQTSTTIGPSSVTSANPGGGGPFSAFSTQIPSFSNSGMSNQNNSQPPTSLFSQNINTTTNLLPVLSNASGAHFNGFGQTTPDSQSLVNMPKETSAADASIWLKEVWKLGEIPEDIPPAEYIRFKLIVAMEYVRIMEKPESCSRSRNSQ
ncbi:hypothetical protein V2J09_005693 [Rumex salicifolius]